MSSSCERIRPLLSLVAEGEAAPEEAMAAARHLPCCTGCRIVLARERRLARMLEHEMVDPLEVGEEFVRSVMARLPHDPPPGDRRRMRLAERRRAAGG